jgi:hypothetical protein
MCRRAALEGRVKPGHDGIGWTDLACAGKTTVGQSRLFQRYV